MRIWVLALVCSLAVTLPGCADAGLQDQVAILRGQVAALMEHTDSLKGLIEQLDGRSNVNGFLLDGLSGRGSVVLDPAGGEGFTTHHTTYGTVTFSVTGVTTVGDGSRVSLQVGNLTSASILGGKMKAEFGERAPERWQEYLEWRQSLREREVSFTTTLSPGRWNSLTITLPGVPPDKLGHLRLSDLEFPRISLSR